MSATKRDLFIKAGHLKHRHLPVPVSPNLDNPLETKNNPEAAKHSILRSLGIPLSRHFRPNHCPGEVHPEKPA
jgi:hypothetical protein